MSNNSEIYTTIHVVRFPAFAVNLVISNPEDYPNCVQTFKGRASEIISYCVAQLNQNRVSCQDILIYARVLRELGQYGMYERDGIFRIRESS